MQEKSVLTGHLSELKQKIENGLEELKSSKELYEFKSEYLEGKKSKISGLMKEMKNIAPEERANYGKSVNELKEWALGRFQKVEEEMKERELQKKYESEKIDLTLPAEETAIGNLHPVTLIRKQLIDIFAGMGFEVYEGREIETDYYNFTALNTPQDHPARDMQDTYYLTNGQLLKSQTSAAQNAILRKYRDSLVNNGTPIKAIFPGRCFRNEATDACHENTFFQMEGMMVGKDISISNLIYFMKTMLSEVFQKDIKVRLRPGFFPFVEPGFELDISCLICGGEGCPSCKHSGWLELCPCGMIHPEVLRMGGIDPDEYTGFAFGLGLTRLVMMKYGIKDIRDLNGGSLKAMSQFTDDE